MNMAIVEAFVDLAWTFSIFGFGWWLTSRALKRAERRMDEAKAMVAVAVAHRKAVSEAIMLYNYGAREEAKELLEGTPYSFGEPDEKEKQSH